MLLLNVQRRKFGDGPISEAAQHFTQVSNRRGQGLFGIVLGKVLQALVNELKLLDQAAQRFNAFVQTCFATLLQGVTQGLHGKVCAIDNLADQGPGRRFSGDGVRLQA